MKEVEEILTIFDKTITVNKNDFQAIYDKIAKEIENYEYYEIVDCEQSIVIDAIKSKDYISNYIDELNYEWEFQTKEGIFDYIIDSYKTQLIELCNDYDIIKTYIKDKLDYDDIRPNVYLKLRGNIHARLVLKTDNLQGEFGNQSLLQSELEENDSFINSLLEFLQISKHDFINYLNQNCNYSLTTENIENKTYTQSLVDMKQFIIELFHAYYSPQFTIPIALDIQKYDNIYYLWNDEETTEISLINQYCGFYDSWNGSGSLFECIIENNKIIKVGKDSNWSIEIEGMNGYSIKDCYGQYMDGE